MSRRREYQQDPELIFCNWNTVALLLLLSGFLVNKNYVVNLFDQFEKNEGQQLIQHSEMMKWNATIFGKSSLTTVKCSNSNNAKYSTGAKCGAKQTMSGETLPTFDC